MYLRLSLEFLDLPGRLMKEESNFALLAAILELTRQEFCTPRKVTPRKYACKNEVCFILVNDTEGAEDTERNTHM